MYTVIVCYFIICKNMNFIFSKKIMYVMSFYLTKLLFYSILLHLKNEITGLF